MKKFKHSDTTRIMKKLLGIILLAIIIIGIGNFVLTGKILISSNVGSTITDTGGEEEEEDDTSSTSLTNSISNSISPGDTVSDPISSDSLSNDYFVNPNQGETDGDNLYQKDNGNTDNNDPNQNVNPPSCDDLVIDVEKILLDKPIIIQSTITSTLKIETIDLEFLFDESNINKYRLKDYTYDEETGTYEINEKVEIIERQIGDAKYTNFLAGKKYDIRLVIRDDTNTITYCKGDPISIEKPDEKVVVYSPEKGEILENKKTIAYISSVEEDDTVSIISAEDTIPMIVDITFTKDISNSEIEVEVEFSEELSKKQNNLEDLKFSENIEKPAEKMLSYYTITKDNIKDEDMKVNFLTFMIPNIFLEDMNLDADEVTFYRYTDEWEVLIIKEYKEIDGGLEYTVLTPGFSIIGIGGPQEDEEEKKETEDKEEPETEDEPKDKNEDKEDEPIDEDECKKDSDCEDIEVCINGNCESISQDDVMDLIIELQALIDAKIQEGHNVDEAKEKLDEMKESFNSNDYRSALELGQETNENLIETEDSSEKTEDSSWIWIVVGALFIIILFLIKFLTSKGKTKKRTIKS